MRADSPRRRPPRRQRKALDAPAEAPAHSPLPPLPHGKEACDRAQLRLPLEVASTENRNAT